MGVMFILGIFVLFAGSFGYNIQPEYSVEGRIADIINATLEKIRPLIPDPLTIADLSIDLPAEGLLVGGANISNFELTGLQGFQVPFLNFDLFSGMRLDFTFVLPSINLTTDYWADIIAGDLFPFYGDGKANVVQISNATLQGTGQADLSKGIAVKNLRIQLFLESATFDIHGLFYDEDFSLSVSSFLNGVDSFIDNHQELISDFVSPIIEAILNIILSGGGESKTVEGHSWDNSTSSIADGAYKLP